VSVKRVGGEETGKGIRREWGEYSAICVDRCIDIYVDKVGHYGGTHVDGKIASRDELCAIGHLDVAEYEGSLGLSDGIACGVQLKRAVFG
jgi:hypothetical protein